MLLDFHPRDCKELFSMLDDGDGEIETDEFFEGLGKMKGVAQSKDLYRLLKSISKLQTTLVRLHVAEHPNLMGQFDSLLSTRVSQLSDPFSKPQSPTRGSLEFQSATRLQ